MGLNLSIIQEIQQKKNFSDPDYFVKRHFLKSHFWNQIIRKYPGRFQHVFVSEFLRKCFFEDNIYIL